MSKSVQFAVLCFLSGCFALIGCKGGRSPRSYGVAIQGDPQRGKELIQAYGCGACHIIPGVPGARGLVGPPLNLFADRTMVAGVIPNIPDNLVQWVENPPSIDPKTAMPDLGVSQSQAQDIAAYLYTLR
jgi:cytochrome c